MVRARLPVVRLRYGEVAEAASVALPLAYTHSADHHFHLSANLDNPSPIDIDNIESGRVIGFGTVTNRGRICELLF